jgi:hypothetical protein
MKINKTIGICIAILLAAAFVNAQEVLDSQVDSLLARYDMSYDDGLFNVSFISNEVIPTGTPGKEAGANIMNFSITGTGTSSPYKVIAELVNIRTDITASDGGYDVGGNYNVEVNKSGEGTANMYFDGNYYYCAGQGDGNVHYVLFDVNLKIYQNEILSKQEKFIFKEWCWNQPVTFSYLSSKAPLPMNTDADSKYEKLNVTLNLGLPETKTYRIGAYIKDNRSNYAYAEKTIVVASPQIFNVDIMFDSELLRGFELNNERISLESIFIDGVMMDYGNLIALYNFVRPSPLLSTTNFDTNEIFLTNISFDTSMVQNNKLTELGVNLDANNTVGSYDVTISLENQFGEIIDIQTATVSSWPTTIWFNGTNIYESKINGPYQIGFIKAIKGTQELIYKLNAAQSEDLSYSNFTAPYLPDLNVNDAEFVGDGTDANLTIYNNGTGDASGITVSLYDSNANKVDEFILESLDAGTSTLIQFNDINISQAFAAIDFYNHIEEMNESNNVAELTGAAIVPAQVQSVQPTATTLIFADGQSTQFNVTANGSQPITYNWFLDNNIVSTTNSYIFAPTYYDEGIRQLRVNVTNSNGSDIRMWNINVTPNTMAIFAYVYNQTAMDIGSKVPIDANVSFDGIVLSATSSENPAIISYPADSEITINYTANGFVPYGTNYFFDKRLFTCIQGQNCVLTNTYNTNCIWETSSWSCSNTNGATTNYFRLFTNPKRVKIEAFLRSN